MEIDSYIFNEDLVLVDTLIRNDATVYIVGGAVRDYYLNYPINDLDLEVYNIDFERIKEICLNLNKTAYVNDKFKTIKINDIEIALPRVELKVGLNYNEYELLFKSDMVPAQAILRRDFTINSLMYNLNEKRLFVYNNALYDLNNKLLKAVDYNKFNEDSIRILRLLKYQSKLNFNIDSKTYFLAKKNSSNLWFQPKNLVRKLLLQVICEKHFNITLFFDMLSDFFGVELLKSKISNNIHHPEKSLYNHLIGSLTCLKLLNVKDCREYQILFWAIFFHDYGKVDCSKNHEIKGVEYFVRYQDFIVSRKKDKKLIQSLIEDHMCIREFALTKNFEKMEQLKRKYNNQFHLLEKVGMCDYGGRVLDFDSREFIIRMKWYQDNILVKYQEESNG